MYTYSTPGVYVQSVHDHQRQIIQHKRTDIAAFIGIAERGPLDQPIKIESWQQFVANFGVHIAQGYLAYAIEGFFTNGGICCWVVRVADSAQANPAYAELNPLRNPGLKLQATSPGQWGQQIKVTLTHSDDDSFTLRLRTARGESETWRDLAAKPTLKIPGRACISNPRYFKRLLNDTERGSHLVTVVDGKEENLEPSEPTTFYLPTDRNKEYVMKGGSDGVETLAPAHFQNALKLLEGIDEPAIIAIPDIMTKPVILPRTPAPRPLDCCVIREDVQTTFLPSSKSAFPPVFDADEIEFLQDELVAHCTRLKDRMAILDMDDTVRDPQSASEWRNRFDSSYAALYYPWIAVPDPLRLSGLLRIVPPSGHIAGLYAQGDLSLGVHKPPANAELLGVKDVVVATDELQHGFLNERHVNVIRSHKERGLRVSGARTLSSESDWRYINVRRLVTMIEGAIDEQLQWIVFEPNDRALWGDIERNIRNFLRRLWRQGMLDGETPDAAFSVTCNDTTNTAYEIDGGRLICEIGLNPPWPAEFVIVRVGITEGGTEVLEERGA